MNRGMKPRIKPMRKGSARSLRPKAGDMKVKVPFNKLTPLAMRMNKGNDDEISSDEEDEGNSASEVRKRKRAAEEEEEEDENEQEEDENEQLETAEEKRVRLAKQYLRQMETTLHDDEKSENESDQDDHNFISEKLRRDRLKSKGRLATELSQGFHSLSMDDITSRSIAAFEGSVTSLAVSQDESILISGSKDNSVIRWDIETGAKDILKRKWQRKLDGDMQSNQMETLAVAITSDGRYIASGGRDRIVRIFDNRANNSEVKVFPGHRDAVSGLCFQSGTYNLFSSSFDRCVKYFDLSELAYIETLFGHQDAITGIDCWHKQRPLTASADRSTRSWKVQENSHLVFRGHLGAIDACQILNDENFISGGQDGRINLWNHGKRAPSSFITAAHGIDSISKTPNWITSLSTIKASDVFASGSYDGNVRIWSVTKDNHITPAVTLPVEGVINDIHLSSRLMIAACGREHRFGRWWNFKKAKDQLLIMRFQEDLEGFKGSKEEEIENVVSSEEDSDEED